MDNLTPEQRAAVEDLKARRSLLATPVERIAFDNDSRNGTFAERIVAMTEVRDCEQGCGRQATVYAMDPLPGGWGGRYCDECPRGSASPSRDLWWRTSRLGDRGLPVRRSAGPCRKRSPTGRRRRGR